MRTPTGPLGLAALAAIGVALAAPARAEVIITMLETGTGVTVAGSGTVNLSALTRVDATAATSSINPGSGQVISGGPVDLYQPVNGTNQFGTDGGFISASSSSGDAFIAGLLSLIGVPQGYVSGDKIAFTMDFSGYTLSTLTVTEGSYTWSWGSGDSFDSMTLRIGNRLGAAVPEPASALLLGAGLLGLAGLRRRA